jgi:hypothetical protein
VDPIDRVVANAHPSTWQFTDEVLDAWPSAVADRALDAVRRVACGFEPHMAALGVSLGLGGSGSTQTYSRVTH